MCELKINSEPRHLRERDAAPKQKSIRRDHDLGRTDITNSSPPCSHLLNGVVHSTQGTTVNIVGEDTQAQKDGEVIHVFNIPSVGASKHGLMVVVL